MKGYLKRISLVQFELMHGMFGEVNHEILHDPDTRIAVEISDNEPYSEKYGLISDEGVKLIEDFLSGKEKPIKNVEEIERHSIVYFDSTDLEGGEYTPIRAVMIALKNVYKNYESKKKELEEFCIKAGLVNPEK